MAAPMRLDSRRYGKLVAEAGATSIRTKEEYRRLLGEMNRLLDKGQGNLAPEEEALVGTLADLLETFERRTWPRQAVGPAELLTFLMEENGLRQQDLCDLLYASRGAVSDVVHGRRAISREHAKRLGKHFRLDPRAFLTL